MKAAFADKTPNDLAVILGRLNSVLQLLNVSLSRLRKDGVRKRWMADGIDGHQNKPSEEIIALWIAAAFKHDILKR